MHPKVRRTENAIKAVIENHCVGNKSHFERWEGVSNKVEEILELYKNICVEYVSQRKRIREKKDDTHETFMNKMATD